MHIFVQSSVEVLPAESSGELPFEVQHLRDIVSFAMATGHDNFETVVEKETFGSLSPSLSSHTTKTASAGCILGNSLDHVRQFGTMCVWRI